MIGLVYCPIESESIPCGFDPSEMALDQTFHYGPYTEPTYEMFRDQTIETQSGSHHYSKTYVPHGVSDVFRQPPSRSVEIRTDFNVDEDAIVVSTVAGNDMRKRLDLWLKCAGRVKERYDGDVRFVMHTPPRMAKGDDLFGSWRLRLLAES